MRTYDHLRFVAHRLAVARRPRHEWTLIFLHIPKTAGTSLRQAIGSAYEPHERLYLYDNPSLEGSLSPKEFKQLPEETRARLRFVMGHIPFGLHRSIPRESRYVVVLRDPVERVVSHYYHYRQVVDPGKTNRAAAERRLIESEGVSLEDWAFGLERAEADNQLVRQISGKAGLRYGQCTEGTLAQAIENIDEHFEMVMFAESMTVSARMLGSRLGFAIPMQEPANVNARRPGVADLDSQVVDRLRELNRFDVELYERMWSRFQGARGAAHGLRWRPWA